MVVIVEKTKLCSLTGIDLSGCEKMFERAGFADDWPKGHLTASLGDETDRILVLGDERIGSGEAHVHLTVEFLPTTEGTAVDLGNECCACDVLEKTATSHQLSESCLTCRCDKIPKVKMGDEVVGYGRGEDDDLRSGLEKPRLCPEKEIVEVGDQFDCQEVDWRVVDRNSSHVGILCEVELAMARRRRAIVALVKEQGRSVWNGSVSTNAVADGCPEEEECCKHSENAFEMHCLTIDRSSPVLEDGGTR